MLFYSTLFLSLLYFKIFRVRRKHEKIAALIKTESLLTNSVILGLIAFGFMTQPWYSVLIAIAVMTIID
jgi:NADH:ubiquinone oxidoreductase subunit K